MWLWSPIQKGLRFRVRINTTIAVSNRGSARMKSGIRIGNFRAESGGFAVSVAGETDVTQGAVSVAVPDNAVSLSDALALYDAAAAILEAVKEQYDALTEHEKSLVDEALKDGLVPPGMYRRYIVEDGTPVPWNDEL